MKSILIFMLCLPFVTYGEILNTDFLFTKYNSSVADKFDAAVKEYAAATELLAAATAEYKTFLDKIKGDSFFDIHQIETVEYEYDGALYIYKVAKAKFEDAKAKFKSAMTR